MRPWGATIMTFAGAVPVVVARSAALSVRLLSKKLKERDSARRAVGLNGTIAPGKRDMSTELNYDGIALQIEAQLSDLKFTGGALAETIKLSNLGLFVQDYKDEILLALRAMKNYNAMADVRVYCESLERRIARVSAACDRAEGERGGISEVIRAALKANA